MTRPSGEGRIATEVAGWAEPTALGTLIRDALIRRNSQQRDCEDPCKMTYTISASSTRHPVAPLGYSAPWPAATIEVNVREVLLENDLALACRFRAVQLRLVAVADGCGARRWPAKEERKCRSMRVQLSNHSSTAWRPAMPWVQR